VGTNLFGDGTGIFAEVTSNLLKRSPCIQLAFHIKSVCGGKMFMVSWDIFTHDVSFYCCQEQKHHNMYAGLNSTYA